MRQNSSTTNFWNSGILCTYILNVNIHQISGLYSAVKAKEVYFMHSIIQSIEHSLSFLLPNFCLCTVLYSACSYWSLSNMLQLLHDRFNKPELIQWWLRWRWLGWPGWHVHSRLLFRWGFQERVIKLLYPSLLYCFVQFWGMHPLAGL